MHLTLRHRPSRWQQHMQTAYRHCPWMWPLRGEGWTETASRCFQGYRCLRCCWRSATAGRRTASTAARCGPGCCCFGCCGGCGGKESIIVSSSEHQFFLSLCLRLCLCDFFKAITITHITSHHITSHHITSHTHNIPSAPQGGVDTGHSSTHTLQCISHCPRRAIANVNRLELQHCRAKRGDGRCVEEHGAGRSAVAKQPRARRVNVGLHGREHLRQRASVIAAKHRVRVHTLCTRSQRGNIQRVRTDQS